MNVLVVGTSESPKGRDHMACLFADMGILRRTLKEQSGQNSFVFRTGSVVELLLTPH